MITESTLSKQNEQKQNKMPVSEWRMRILHDYSRAFVCIPTKMGAKIEVYLN